MRKNLVVGILRETKYKEARTPLTPADVQWLKERFIDVEVESSNERAFSDSEYRRAGAIVLDTCSRASLLIGVKEPQPHSLQSNKVYMVFSHTIKGQCNNMPLLQTSLKKGITLIDFEKIEGHEGGRLVYFGRFAGICGTIDALCGVGKKLKLQGIESPFSLLKMAHQYASLKKAKKDVIKVAHIIRRRGLNKHISPFVVGITGHGNVSDGIQEILGIFKPIEIHPKEMRRFVKTNKSLTNKICQIIFDREEKLRARNKKSFYFEEYLKHPQRFESNMDIYLPYLNVLLHGSYWDARFPRLVTKAMVHTIWSRPSRLVFIADIACDINGSIELTSKATTVDQPVYTYNPKTRKYSDGYTADGISILARDNLPSELPREASEDFSALIREYVYQIAAHGVIDVANHAAIPQEIRRAVIVQDGKLTSPYAYLKRCLK